MKRLMINIRLYVILVATIALGGCQEDANLFVKPDPVVLPLNAPTLFVQERGLPVMVDVELQAASGLNELKVFKNEELFDTREFNSTLLETYNFNYVVESNLTDGTRLNFRFELTDAEGRSANPYTLAVRVGPPYEIKDAEIFGLPVKHVKGRINRDEVFEAGINYWLDSLVSVEQGAKLTIEAGTTLYMRTYDNGIDTRLVITQGSQLIANGTAEEPIVLTSDRTINGTASVNDWGGVWLYGRAPSNQSAIVFDNGFTYGGTNESDNSGTLRYIRSEFAGKNDSDGFHFFGVGNETVVDFLQVYRCGDNAVFLKGGTVDIKHLVCTGFAAYGLWAEHGWRGRGQFWVFHTDVAATLIPVNFNNQARSVELRNDPNDFNLQPATYAHLSNITMIGNGTTTDNGTRRGIRVRRGAMGIIRNIIVTNFPDDGVRVEDVQQSRLDDGTMLIADVRSFGNRRNWNQQAESYFLPQSKFNLSSEAVPGVNANSFVGSVDSPFNPRTDSDFGNWFENASFIGAVENASNDWTSAGEWCRDLNGNIR